MRLNFRGWDSVPTYTPEDKGDAVTLSKILEMLWLAFSRTNWWSADLAPSTRPC